MISRMTQSKSVLVGTIATMSDIHCEQCGQVRGDVNWDEIDGCPHGNDDTCHVGSMCPECCIMCNCPPAF